ncbi:hypothetical protein CLOM_g6578 [Closterium sp. NIES-68]|nr:hypothetical protein CLOM_g6578 [Closterium sp. NIES-68]GJP82222.1 hypothetical protein CLOP_g12460 [Closterium sp. NIES-67]
MVLAVRQTSCGTAVVDARACCTRNATTPRQAARRCGRRKDGRSSCGECLQASRYFYLLCRCEEAKPAVARLAKRIDALRVTAATLLLCGGYLG